MVDQGKNWALDRFYHGLVPSFRDALEFAMAELLKSRYPTPVGRVETLADKGILPPDLEPLEQGVPEPDVIEGLSLRMTQVINHYQQEEHHCFICGAPDHFAQFAPTGTPSACGRRSSLTLMG